MSDKSSVAAEFVSAYYFKLAFKPAEIPKFYDQEKALIWRKELDQKDAVKFEDAVKCLVPAITKGSKIVISDFVVIDNENGFLINVSGYVSHESEAKRTFQQVFELEEVENRFVVVKDILKNVVNMSKEEEEEFEKKLYKLPKTNKRYPSKKKNNTPSKFIYKA